MKKIVSVALVLMLAMGLTLPISANSQYFSDLEGHWSAQYADKLYEYGVVQGDAESDTARPEHNITRAEFAAMINRAMGYDKLNLADKLAGFSDTASLPAWQRDAMNTGIALGYIGGYEDGTVRAGRNITRQEAAKMLATAINITKPGAAYQNKFTDAAAVEAAWGSDFILALAQHGVFGGDTDGNFNPNLPIRRGEAFKIISTVMGLLIDGEVDGQNGTYTFAMVRYADKSLENATVRTLIITEGVGDGDVTLKNVTVENLIVKGGGLNSIKLAEGTVVTGKIIVNVDASGDVRIFNEAGNELPTVEVNDGHNGVLLEGSFDKVSVGAGAEITIAGEVNAVEVTGESVLTVGETAVVKALDVAAENVNVTIEGTVTAVNVLPEAQGSQVKVAETAYVETLVVAAANASSDIAGTVMAVEVQETAQGSALTVEKTAHVENVTTAADEVKIEGEGTIAKVEVTGGTGTVVEAPVVAIENSSGNDVALSDGKTVETGSNASTGSTTDIPPANTPGGGETDTGSGTGTGTGSGSTSGGDDDGGYTPPPVTNYANYVSVPSGVTKTASVSGTTITYTLTGTVNTGEVEFPDDVAADMAWVLENKMAKTSVYDGRYTYFSLDLGTVLTKLGVTLAEDTVTVVQFNEALGAVDPEGFPQNGEDLYYKLSKPTKAQVMSGNFNMLLAAIDEVVILDIYDGELANLAAADGKTPVATIEVDISGSGKLYILNADDAVLYEAWAKLPDTFALEVGVSNLCAKLKTAYNIDDSIDLTVFSSQNSAINDAKEGNGNVAYGSTPQEVNVLVAVGDPEAGWLREITVTIPAAEQQGGDEQGA